MHPAGHLFPFALLAASLYAEVAYPQSEYPTMQIIGEHRYLHHGIFKVYDATLLTPHGADTTVLLSANEPFELRFHYLRTIKKATVLKSANRMLEKNLHPDDLRKISDETDQLHTVYTNIKKGDRASLRYHPQHGTVFTFNGKQRITLSGKDFAKYYFSIWFGPKPVSLDLRDALLGH